MAGPMARRRRLVLAALLFAALAPLGWGVFVLGAAGLVLGVGECASRAPVDAVVLGWLLVLAAMVVVPPVLLAAKGRWAPPLVALGVGGAVVVAALVAARLVLPLSCG